MRFLLITLGSHGDIHPFFALSQALSAQGHQAPVLTNPYFAKQAQRAGVPLLPIAEPLDLRELMQTPGAMHPIHGPRVVLRNMLLPKVSHIFARTSELIAEFKPDALVIHPICLGASWAAERAGIPCVTVALAPISYMNPNDTIVFGPWRGQHPSHRAVAFDLFVGRHVMALLLDGKLNQIRKTLGLPKARHQLFAEFLRPGLSLALWSPHFRPPLPGDPNGAVVCGFPWFDAHHDHHDHHPGPSPLDAFLAHGPPPIVFTLGTAAVHTPGNFYAHAVDACRALNRRGVLLVGRPEAVPRDLPPSIHACAYAPFSTLLPKAALTVHHGGIGSTAQALRAGRPTLICPLSHDQFDNAARCARLGTSLTLPHAKTTARTLTQALDELLSTPTLAAKADVMGRSVAGEDGAARAAEALGRQIAGL